MIDDETMARIEKLAGLELSQEERQALKGDLERILAYFQKLGEVETNGVPMFEPLPGRTNAWRDDEPRESLPPEEALGNAPESEGGYFKVPPVFGGEEDSTD
jgi:aspartyl-tRNA(Asn)/glutamyl-tRNA(Gln) amidotransferase subunit C